MDTQPPYRCFGLRRLNPFRGVIQVLATRDARALSADGTQWEIQVAAERRDVQWGSASPDQLVRQFLRFGVWSAQRGLRRLAVLPRLDSPLPVEETAMLVDLLRDRLPQLPFPPADRVELWLLDARRQLPLALLASTEHPDSAARPLAPRWQAAPRGEPDFSSGVAAGLKAQPGDPNPRPHIAALERLVRLEAGPGLAQWFERDARGAGSGLAVGVPRSLAGRQLPAEMFPELTLRARWSDPQAQMLVDDYLGWLAPYLLALAGIADGTRAALEPLACRRAALVAEYFRLYPKIMNPAAMDVARVEARLRE